MDMNNKYGLDASKQFDFNMNDFGSYDSFLKSPFFEHFLKPAVLTIGSYFSAKAALFIGSSLHSGYNENVRTLWQTYDLLDKYGEYVVITNVKDKIGTEFAKQFAREGHSLILIGEKGDDEFEEVLPSISKCIRRQEGREIRVIDKDTDHGDFNIYKAIEDELDNDEIRSKIGILVNNAGVVGESKDNFLTVTSMAILDDVHTRIVDFLMVTKTMLRVFVRNKKGLIVNITPAGSCLPFSDNGFPVSMKQFVAEFNKTVRKELVKCSQLENIKFEELNPGRVCTCNDSKSHTMIPTTEEFVKSAFKVLGKVSSSTGYWYYSLQNFFSAFVPEFVTSMLYEFTKQTFQANTIKASAESCDFLGASLAESGKLGKPPTLIKTFAIEEAKSKFDYEPIPSSDEAKSKQKATEYSTISMDMDPK